MNANDNNLLTLNHNQMTRHSGFLSPDIYSIGDLPHLKIVHAN